MTLRTDFKDEVLPEGQKHRLYNFIDQLGNKVLEKVYLEKAYVPAQEGDDYGAGDVNAQNKAINDLIGSGVKPVSEGGTGADNAADARTNLGLDEASLRTMTAGSAFTVTLTASAWRDNALTISDPRFLTGDYAYFVAPQDVIAYGNAGIYAEDIKMSGFMTFKAMFPPKKNLLVNIFRTEAK